MPKLEELKYKKIEHFTDSDYDIRNGIHNLIMEYFRTENAKNLDSGLQLEMILSKVNWIIKINLSVIKGNRQKQKD